MSKSSSSQIQVKSKWVKSNKTGRKSARCMTFLLHMRLFFQRSSIFKCSHNYWRQAEACLRWICIVSQVSPSIDIYWHCVQTDRKNGDLFLFPSDLVVSPFGAFRSSAFPLYFRSTRLLFYVSSVIVSSGTSILRLYYAFSEFYIL